MESNQTKQANKSLALHRHVRDLAKSKTGYFPGCKFWDLTPLSIFRQRSFEHNLHESGDQRFHYIRYHDITSSVQKIIHLT